jgi:hypothetical protein
MPRSLMGSPRIVVDSLRRLNIGSVICRVNVVGVPSVGAMTALSHVDHALRHEAPCGSPGH